MRAELNLVAKVTAIARDVWAPSPTGGDVCIGSPTSDRIHVSVADDAGLTWELSLSPSQVDEHHFAVGDELSIQYSVSEPALFTRDQRLVIRTAGDIDLFFVYGSNSFQIPGKPFGDSSLALSNATVECDGTSPSGAACSTQRATVAVSDGATSFNEPCAQNIGPFQVSADFTAADCGGTPAGFCDATSTLYLAGVRR